MADDDLLTPSGDRSWLGFLSVTEAIAEKRIRRAQLVQEIAKIDADLAAAGVALGTRRAKPAAADAPVQPPTAARVEIERVLTETRGVVAAAADLLGITTKTLRRRLADEGIDPESYRTWQTSRPTETTPCHRCKNPFERAQGATRRYCRPCFSQLASDRVKKQRGQAAETRLIAEVDARLAGQG